MGCFLTRNQASYVSPSDDIMSPCSKKLSDLKGKRFKKYVFDVYFYFLSFNSTPLDLIILAPEDQPSSPNDEMKEKLTDDQRRKAAIALRQTRQEELRAVVVG